MDNAYNPENSPFFMHWEYTGNAFQRSMKTGPKKPVFQTEESYFRQRWVEGDRDVIIGFADAHPEATVVEVDKLTGERKAIKLPNWVLAREQEEDLGYYYEQSPWAFRCVNIKAHALSAIPWEVRLRGKNDALKTHEAITLLEEVNPESNWRDTIQAVSKDLDIYGKGFLWKVRASEEQRTATSGKVKFLMRLNPQTMKVVSDRSGISHFEQTLDGRPEKFARENIIYFHDYDPDDDFGSVSPTEAAVKVIKVEIESDKHLASFFENKAMPSVVMVSKEEVADSELRRLMRVWNQQFRGADKQHKTGFLSHGFEPKEMSYSPDRLALGEVRAEIRREICAAYGVPPALAGAWEAANYATADVQRKFLYTEVILPRARYIEGVINAELMNEYKNTVEFAFVEDGLPVMQEDMNTKAERIGGLVDKGVITPETGAGELGYDATSVPDKPPPDDGPSTKTAKIPAGEELEDDGEDTIAEDLNKWRKKAIKRVKAGKSAKCSFNSTVIPDVLHEAISEGLGEAETVGDVVEVFGGKKTAKKDAPTEVKVHFEPHIHNEMPETKVSIGQPDIHVNVEPTPVEVHPPEVKVDVDVEAPEVKIANPTIEEHIHIDMPKQRMSRERQEVARDNKGHIKGSETIVEHFYDEDME